MQREGSGYLVLLQHICSTKEESDIFLLWRSVFNFIGMATGLHEAKEWIEREKGDRLTTTTTTTTTIKTMIVIIIIIAYCRNSTNCRIYRSI